MHGLIPPLAGSDYLAKNQDQVACIIRFGQKGPIEVNGKIYDQEMQGIGRLSDFEIANVINYINHAWGNDLGYRQIQEIQSNLENCEPSD